MAGSHTTKKHKPFRHLTKTRILLIRWSGALGTDEVQYINFDTNSDQQGELSWLQLPLDVQLVRLISAARVVGEPAGWWKQDGRVAGENYGQLW